MQVLLVLVMQDFSNPFSSNCSRRMLFAPPNSTPITKSSASTTLPVFLFLLISLSPAIREP